MLLLGGAQVTMRLPSKIKTPTNTPTTTKKKSTVNNIPATKEVIVCTMLAFSLLGSEEGAKVKELGRTVADVRWVLDCVSYYKVLPLSDYEVAVA